MLEPPEEPDEAAEARYVSDLIARGEAAEPDEHGELPEHATHEIYTDEHGRRRVRRRRFFAG